MAKSTNNIVYVLRVLEKYSSAENPLKQNDILDHLREDYDVELDRKAVSNCLDGLSQAFEKDEDDNRKIVTDGRKGVYLVRALDDRQIRVLIDSVVANKHISTEETKKIRKTLKSLGTPELEKAKFADILTNTRAKDLKLFDNFHDIEEIIESGSQMRIWYSTYDTSNQLASTNKHDVSPYRIVLHGGNYYLICYDEGFKNLASYRVDKIKTVSPVNGKKTALADIGKEDKDIQLLATLPFMATDQWCRVEFTIPHETRCVNQVVDWFGSLAKIDDRGTYYQITVTSTIFAMEQWASLYLDMVTIISPEPLVQKMKDRIQPARKNYRIK